MSMPMEVKTSEGIPYSGKQGACRLPTPAQLGSRSSRTGSSGLAVLGIAAVTALGAFADAFGADRSPRIEVSNYLHSAVLCTLLSVK
jgi:hypothetical protein